MEGRLLLELETADLSRLREAGWKAPEIFKTGSAEGGMDLWGVMWKPFDFDPTRRYPVIDFVYPGPQDEGIPRTFMQGLLTNNIHLAQYGFIVIMCGNRGGSYNRPVAYSEHYRGNLRDYPLADHKAVIEQLAARHVFIDIERVGIWGGSSGGFMALTAMLTYPDFYKVCVARSGQHDPSLYHSWWSEQFQGVGQRAGPDGHAEWASKETPGNLELARNLKGRLLLLQSEMDMNVHPAHAARMADALMAAGKRFDYFVVPGAGHEWGDRWPYVQRMIWTYFVRHLMGDDRYSVDIFNDFNDGKN
jgi:dipeptidyl aminopeptidase/acylaminoacyl peptidase